MHIDQELTQKIASLARLELSQEEIAEYTTSLQDVLDAFSKLQEVDTENLEPSFHPVILTANTREDKEKKCLTQKEALSQTTHQRDGFFIGPKAL